MAVNGFPAMDILQKMLLIFHKLFICKFPSFWINLSKSIGVELTDEAGEVVVLEVGGKEDASELGRVPDDEAVIGWGPRDDLVRRRVVDHVVRLQQKRRRSSAATSVHFVWTMWRSIDFEEPI